MQEKAHTTPGPWYVEQQDDMDVEGNGYVWAVRAEGHGSYCQNPARSNSLANARLMAAAPELLAELEYVSEWVKTGKVAGVKLLPLTVADSLDAAIAKAK